MTTLKQKSQNIHKITNKIRYFENEHVSQSWLRRFAWLLIIMWSATVAGLLSWNIYTARKMTQEVAISEARVHVKRDSYFYLWATTHGGLYEPADERIPPNPFLEVPEHNLDMQSGDNLVLMTPAHALRQMNEEFAERYGIVGHITSLYPLRPQNAPDDWERAALESFEQENQEVFEFVHIDGEPYLRLMQPLITQKECLQCHDYQEHQVGYADNGVAVVLLMDSYLDKEQKIIISNIFSLGLLWLIGLISIQQGKRLLGRSFQQRDQAAVMLQTAHEKLEAQFEQRTVELQESEQRFRLLHELAPLGYQSLDENGCLLAVNSAWVKEMGYTREEVIGRWFGDFIVPEQRELYRGRFSSFKEIGRKNGTHYKVIRQDGTQIVAIFESKVVCDESGNFVRTQCIMQNITDRVQREVEIKLYMQQLEVLQEVSLKLTANLPLQDGLDMLLTYILQLAAADNAHIFTYDGNTLHFDAVRWGDNRSDKPFAEPRQDGITYTVARTGKRVIVNDMSRSPFYAGWPLVGTIVGLPLIHAEQVVGVLTVATRMVCDFGNKELRVLELLADQAATVINNAALYDTIQRYVDRLETLNTITAVLSTSLKLDNVLELILDQIGKVIPFDSTAVFLHEADGERVMVVRGIPIPVKGQFFPAGNKLFQEIRETGVPLILDDPRSTRRFQNWGASKQIQSWMGIPLIARDILIGYLTLDSHDANTYSPEHATLALSFASQAAQAIENARLYARVSQNVDELDRRVRERTGDLQQRIAEVEQLNKGMLSLLADLQIANEYATKTALELEEINAELESFAYSVSHDLRSPLRHISGFVTMLEKREQGRLDEKSDHYLRVIGKAAVKMGQLIDDLLAFSHTSRKELSTRPVNSNNLIVEVQQELTPDIEHRDIIWKIDTLPTVMADPSLLRQVWMNLIENAIKYTAPCSPAHIQIGTIPSDEDGEIIFFVHDNGVGFNADYADKLFNVFQRLHRDEEFEGTGIGLATVRRIIHRHHGRIWAEGDVDKGATFYFTLRSGLFSIE